MHVLVTGAAGFAGRHLCKLLKSQGSTVHALVSKDARQSFVEGASNSYTADILDFEELCKILEKSQPKILYHLAALAAPEKSWKSSRRTHETNYIGVMNVLEAALHTKIGAKIILVGSASAYGAVPPERQPVQEIEPLRPRDPYGVSKAAAELLGYQYWIAHNMDIVLLRPFNHTGPNQGAGFVCSDFARQIAQIEAGQLPPIIRVGNLAAERDFTDVRDMVAAYYLAALHCKPGVPYNIGQGTARSIKSILARLLELSHIPIAVEVDPSKFRPLDTPKFACDATLFKQETGWTLQYDFMQQTLPDLLDSWRKRVSLEV